MGRSKRASSITGFEWRLAKAKVEGIEPQSSTPRQAAGRQVSVLLSRSPEAIRAFRPRLSLHRRPSARSVLAPPSDPEPVDTELERTQKAVAAEVWRLLREARVTDRWSSRGEELALVRLDLDALGDALLALPQLSRKVKDRLRINIEHDFEELLREEAAHR